MSLEEPISALPTTFPSASEDAVSEIVGTGQSQAVVTRAPNLTLFDATPSAEAAGPKSYAGCKPSV